MAPVHLALGDGQARNVHAQGAAQRDVQDLHAAARSEEGLVRGERSLDELQLEGVALMAEQALVIRLLDAPQRRVDVVSARDGDAVRHLYIACDDVLVLGECHDERQSACGEDRLEEHGGPGLLGRRRSGI